jgi:hypothetical protein
MNYEKIKRYVEHVERLGLLVISVISGAGDIVAESARSSPSCGAACPRRSAASPPTWSRPMIFAKPAS